MPNHTVLMTKVQTTSAHFIAILTDGDSLNTAWPNKWTLLNTNEQTMTEANGWWIRSEYSKAQTVDHLIRLIVPWSSQWWEVHSQMRPQWWLAHPQLVPAACQPCHSLSTAPSALLLWCHSGQEPRWLPTLQRCHSWWALVPRGSCLQQHCQSWILFEGWGVWRIACEGWGVWSIVCEGLGVWKILCEGPRMYLLTDRMVGQMSVCTC